MTQRPRRGVPALGNFLVLIGGIVIGSSIAVATPAQERLPLDIAATTTPSVPVFVQQPSTHHHPLPDAPVQAATATPADNGHQARSEQATVVPSPVERPPLPPHAGEGLLQPATTLTPSPWPYAQNAVAARLTHIAVPAVGIDTEVVEVAPVAIQVGQQTVFEWPVADWAAGHHSSSANPGEGGNVVIAGHDDVRGEVFRGLHDIEVGDQVIVTTGDTSFTYVVQEIHLRLFNNQPLEEQLSVGGFIGPMPEERLTLVTCWPYRVDTHRLIVVAKPGA
jgi:sortase A